MTQASGAIIIGGHFQGLGVIRSLAKYGIETIVLDHQPNLSRFSKYIRNYYKSPDPLNREQLLAFLIDLATKKSLKGWVIYPTDDETVYFLSKEYKKLSKYFSLITPPWQSTKFAYNKKLSYQLAEKIGIPIPKTYYPSDLKDLKGMDIMFPIVIKPAVMRTFFKQTKKKVFRARNRAELENYYQIASSIIKPDEILIQEEIPEVAKNLYSFCPFFKNKRVIARIVAQRIRQHPMDFGQASTYAQTVDIPELEKIGTRFLSEIDFYGLCEVEFIQDPRDRIFKFLEVNPRIWGWHTLAQKAGVNLPYIAMQDSNQHEITQIGFIKDVKWFRLVTDVPTVMSEILKGRMKIGDYLNSLKGEKEFAVFSLNDPLPFLGELLLLPYLSIKRGF